MRCHPHLLLGLLLVPATFAGCGDSPVSSGPGQVLHTYSFEKDMDGRDVKGTDLSVGDRPIEWSVARNLKMARNGSASVKLTTNSLTDAGKIWMEKPFAVKPGRAYHVTVECDFASADYGPVNLSRIITGLLPQPPLTEGHGKGVSALGPSALQGDTGNGSDRDTGHRWLSTRYALTAQAGQGEALYPLVGVWGTIETDHTYYLDDVRVSLNEG